MALIGAEVQKIQNYWEGVQKNPRTEFLEEKVGEGEGETSGEARRGSGFASRKGILPLRRRFCLWAGNFASGKGIFL